MQGAYTIVQGEATLQRHGQEKGKEDDTITMRTVPSLGPT